MSLRGAVRLSRRDPLGGPLMIKKARRADIASRNNLLVINIGPSGLLMYVYCPRADSLNTGVRY